MDSLPSIPIPVWEACRLLDARRTYSSALGVMDGDCAWIRGCICDFFFMTSPQLHCRGPRPLTSPGLVHILATPSPPIVWGWPLFPHSFQTDRPCSLQNGPYGSESSALSLLKYMLDVNGQLDTLFGQKTSSCLHNPKHLRRNSLCRYCTFHRKPDFPLLCRVSSPPASQDIYCYCHNDLIEAKEPFVGLELFALQIRAPVQGWLHFTRDFQGLLQVCNIGWCQVNMTLTLGLYIIFRRIAAFLRRVYNSLGCAIVALNGKKGI